MAQLSVLGSVDDLPAAEWDEMTQTADIDNSRGYLQFREYLEPGESVLLTIRSEGRLRGALRGVMTVPESGLTSDPWKFISSTAVLRLRDDDGEAEATYLRGLQHQLVCAAAGERTDTDGPLWRMLTRGIGPCLVVREFERSELLCHPEASLAEVERLTADLIRAAQVAALDKGAGAIAFPFVSPRDGLLREALAEAGFRGGAMTGASRIDVQGCRSYEEFLARLPSRRRRRYRLEERRLLQTAEFSVGEIDLMENADRVAELEAQTLRKHGGAADPEAIRKSRVELAARLSGAVHISAVERDGRVIACAMHLKGTKSILALSYGCDYGVADRSTSYPWAFFYYPIQMAVAAGAGAVRFGLEGFEAKTRRGAVVEPRELWAWTPNAGTVKRLGDLLDMVDGRNTEYLARFGA